MIIDFNFHSFAGLILLNAINTINAQTGFTRNIQMRIFLKKFIQTESAGGIVMIVFAAIAMLLANSPLSDFYKAAISYHISFSQFEFSLQDFVKDILMVIFFFVVGMELKKEMVDGHLSKKGQKILPLIAAFGGIITPAIIFLIINHVSPENSRGWAIPTATDIAFALCVLTIVGKSVPQSAKIFLLAIAIYDDIAAIIIIAFFYSSGVQPLPFFIAGLTVGVLYFLHKKKIFNAGHILLAIILWGSFHYSGIHTTVAGVILGFFVPSGKTLDSLIKKFHPYVAFFILPLFALVSAGVSFGGLTMDEMFSPLTIGITLGLFFGKQIGILLFTLAAVKLKIAPKPASTSWLDIYGVAVIAGVGFTMSLFIGMLAFTSSTLQEEVKIGVIAGSVLSGLWGAVILKLAVRAKTLNA